MIKYPMLLKWTKSWTPEVLDIAVDNANVLPSLC